MTKTITITTEPPAGSNDEKLSKSEQNRIRWYRYFVELAKARGGKVLSENYIKMHAKMTFECQFGHKFTSKCHDIHQKGTWCPKCAKNQRLTIEDLRTVADTHQGYLVTKIYLGLSIEHVWMCNGDHRFKQTPQNVMYNNAWCPICTKEQKRKKHCASRMAELQLIAQHHNGKILSADYSYSRQPMTCECENGHKFVKKAEQIIQGQWCPDCNPSNCA